MGQEQLHIETTLEISLEGQGEIHKQPKGEEHLSQREQPLQRHRGVKESGMFEGSLSDWRAERLGRCGKGASPGDEVGKVGQEKQ